MLDHPAIDIALSTILFYVILSLVASAVQEWIASLFGLRSKNLDAGIKRLIGDQYAQKIYSHPLIKNLSKENKLPSYIAPETFSTVLLELIAKDNVDKSYVACTADEVRSAIGKIEPGHPLREMFDAWLTEGEDVANVLKHHLASWFDEGMIRISGWYSRRVKVIIFVIAAAVTIATNASSIHLVEQLWTNDALRTQIAAQAQSIPSQSTAYLEMTESLNKLDIFPIGWRQPPDGFLEWLKTILGWGITIAAISLGAPFWFDLLGKFANLKGTGGRAKLAEQESSNRS